MPVDILEGVERGIRHRHKLDDALGGVVRQARALFEIRPAYVVLTDVLGHFDQATRQAFFLDETAQIIDVNVTGHIGFLWAFYGVPVWTAFRFGG
ncbi:hypothetical protein D3C85_1187370 [compost metagenome]